MSSISARALAAMPKPHEAIVCLLADIGPTPVIAIATILRIEVGSLWPALKQLRARGRIYMRGETVFAARYYERKRDGFCVAAIDCVGA